MHRHHSLIIIGAGLSGLYAAMRARQQGRDVMVLEARDRLGGRIDSSRLDDTPESHIDLGPAWVWPQLQPLMNRLISELNLKLFRQFTTGSQLYQTQSGQVERYDRPSSHQHSYRISGGCHALIEALQAQLLNSNIQLNTVVEAIDQQSLSIRTIHHGNAAS